MRNYTNLKTLLTLILLPLLAYTIFFNVSSYLPYVCWLLKISTVNLDTTLYLLTFGARGGTVS